MHVTLPDGLRLACRVENPGSQDPPLILLNGSVFNLHQWKRLVAVGGWTRRFRLIRYDYADTGDSGRRDEPMSVRALAAELVGLMDALGLPAAHFYGISQGTIVLQALAALAPERILSAAGYGWYHGGFSGLSDTAGRIQERVEAFEAFSAGWTAPLDRPAFDALWAAIYREALLGARWEELSVLGKLKDWLARRTLFPLIAPTPIERMHAWFAYCVDQLEAEQPWLDEGLAALRERPLLLQHAVDDQTLEVGMARELAQALPGARLIEYGEGFTHVSPAFKPAHARQVVEDHLGFLTA